jgi:hypothetical protein
VVAYVVCARTFGSMAPPIAFLTMQLAMCGWYFVAITRWVGFRMEARNWRLLASSTAAVLAADAAVSLGTVPGIVLGIVILAAWAAISIDRSEIDVGVGLLRRRLGVSPPS